MLDSGRTANPLRKIAFLGEDVGAGSSLVFLFLSIIIMIISAFRPQFFETIRVGVSDRAMPILMFVSRPMHSISSVIAQTSTLAEIQATNDRLEQENQKLRQWYQIALKLEAENASLRELLNIKLDPKDTFVTARVISDSGNTYAKSLLVQSGKPDGIKKGQAVLSGEGLAGRIIEVGERTSRILLITDINSRVPVMVDKTTQHAVMAGRNDTYPQLIHLPQDSEIEDGSRILTSGYGGVYPYGLPVGKVYTDQKGNKRVDLFTDVTRLLYVRVLESNVDNLTDMP